jgi:hypothetical protein
LNSIDLEQLIPDIGIQGTNGIGLPGAELGEELQGILCGIHHDIRIDKNGSFKGVGHCKQSFLGMEMVNYEVYRSMLSSVPH